MKPDQLEYLWLLASGKTYRGVAIAKGVTYAVVKNALHDLYASLGAQSAAHAVAVLYRKGIFPFRTEPSP